MKFTAEVSVEISGTLEFEAETIEEAKKVLDKLDLSYEPDLPFNHGEIQFPMWDVSVDGPPELLNPEPGDDEDEPEVKL
jgi:hypothetical protein